MAAPEGDGVVQQPAQAVVLYDGVCGLCNRLVQFVLKHDRWNRFRFAALQGDFAQRLLVGQDLDRLSTFYLVLDYGAPSERVLARSTAAVELLRLLDGWWRAAGTMLRVVPRFMRDAVYNLVARHRYRVFGRSERCLVPAAEVRAKFLDASWP